MPKVGATDPLRLIHIFAPAQAGGLESVVQMLALGQHDRGAKVAVVAVLDGDSPEPPSVVALRTGGVTLFIQRSRHRGYRTEWLAHRRYVESWRAEVVHTHGYRADVLAGHAVAGRARRLTTVHGFTGGDWKNRVYEWLQIRTYRGFDAVVAVSRSVRERLVLQGVPSRLIQTISNAWAPPGTQLSRSEARAALGLPADGVVVGWVGRLSPEKGADLFLAAAARISNPAVRLSIVGDGPERSRLESQARLLGLGDRISWHGLVAGAGRLMPAFDLFVLSSRTEGTPIALFEAMAAQVPAVATAVGGVPDVLRSDSGWLVPPESPAELARNIEEALSNKPEAGRRSVRAADYLRTEFMAAPWIDRYLDLSRQLARGSDSIQ